tara:strand:+ start:10429 stop:10686 length:258 start_codon:yes stop_codon:yes gene_type:complete
MARPRNRDKNLDTNYSMRVSHGDRDNYIKVAELLGMSLNGFTNAAVKTIVDLIDCDPKKLPHASDLELVKVGQFMKANRGTSWKK